MHTSLNLIGRRKQNNVYYAFIFDIVLLDHKSIKVMTMLEWQHFPSLLCFFVSEMHSNLNLLAPAGSQWS